MSTTETTPTTTTSTTPEESSNEIRADPDQHKQKLLDKLKNMDEDSCVDPLLVKMLRETTTAPETNSEVLEIIKTMAEELQQKCENITSTTVTPPKVVPGENCQNIEALKILPNDDMKTARKKHGKSHKIS